MKNGQPVEDFQQCAWEGQSMAPYSMTEPYECHEPGIVTHVGAQAPFCEHHFRKFQGGPADWFRPYSGQLIVGLLDLVDECERRVGL